MTALRGSGPVPSAATTSSFESWRTHRRPADDGDWLHLELVAGETYRGEAWDRFSDALEAAVAAVTEQASRTASSRHPDTDAAQPLSRVASGLVEAARSDARCRRLGIPLHIWLGGAIRTELPITLPVRLRSAVDDVARRKDLDRHCIRMRAAADAYGVRSFSVHDASTEPGLIADTIGAVRRAIGPDARLTLRLLGQLSVPDACTLVAMIRGCDLLAVVDPCDTVASSVRATDGSLPALGLSASEYDRTALLECLAAAPPALLFIDPIQDGGLVAARRLAAVANVLHVDVAFTAAASGPWLTAQCLSLAAVLTAAAQPVELPLSWTEAWLDAADLKDGAITLDAIPRLSRVQAALAPI